jgi:protein TonB
MSPLTKDTAELPHQVTDPTAPQPGPSGKQAFPGNPLCMEIPVRVQGSQVILHGTTEHPEFFEEDTTTLILFPQGAVIRLAAGVKPGQKLALTNQKTSEDVLCRVVNVRNYPNVKGYVEIEFTRAAPTFWGVNFPAKVPPPARAAAPPPAPAGQAITPVPVAAPKPRQTPVDSAPTPPRATDDSASTPAAPVSHDVQQHGASLEPTNPAGLAASSIAIEPRPAGGVAYDASAAARANESTKPAAASQPSAPAEDTSLPAIVVPHVADPPAAAVEWRVKEPTIDWALAAPPHSDKGSASSPALLVSPDVGLGAPVEDATQTIAPAPTVEPAAKAGTVSAVDAIAAVPGPTHSGEGNSREEAPPLSPDNWELSIPASSPWSTEAARSAAPQSEPEEQPMAPPPSVAAAAGDRMAGVAAHSSQDLRNPLGRFQQEAALSAHSSDTEDYGMNLGGQSPGMRSLHYERPRPKLVLVFAYATVFLSVVAGGAILFHRQFGSSAKTAAVPSAVTLSAPSPSADAPQPQAGNDATQTQPLVNPDIELSTHDQRSASLPTVAPEEAKEPASTARLPVAGNKPKIAPVRPESIAAPPERAAEAAATALPKSTFQAAPLEAVASKPVARVTTPEKRAAAAEAPVVLGGVPGGVPGAPGSSATGGLAAEVAPANAAPAPPPVSETPRTALRVSGEVTAPRLLHSVQPRYPVVAEENHIEGDVTVQVDVDATGKVAKASAVSGPVMLRQAAVDALRQWRYKPSTVNGEPVPIQLLVTVKFQLPK